MNASDTIRVVIENIITNTNKGLQLVKTTSIMEAITTLATTLKKGNNQVKAIKSPLSFTPNVRVAQAIGVAERSLERTLDIVDLSIDSAIFALNGTSDQAIRCDYSSTAEYSTSLALDTIDNAIDETKRAIGTAERAIKAGAFEAGDRSLERATTTIEKAIAGGNCAIRLSKVALQRDYSSTSGRILQRAMKTINRARAVSELIADAGEYAISTAVDGGHSVYSVINDVDEEEEEETGNEGNEEETTDSDDSGEEDNDGKTDSNDEDEEDGAGGEDDEETGNENELDEHEASADKKEDKVVSVLKPLNEYSIDIEDIDEESADNALKNSTTRRSTWVTCKVQ